MTTPAQVGVTTLILTLSDKTNDREVSASIALASTAANLGDLVVSFDRQSYEITAGGEPVEIGFTIGNRQNAIIEPPVESDVATRLTVNSVTYDPTTGKGKIVVAALESVPAGNVNLTLSVSDNYLRESSGILALTVLSDVPVSDNCYIVKPGESVAFSSRLKTITEVEVSWQDAPQVISTVSLANSTVTVTASNTAGNALVIGKGADGMVLWSWHIWVTDFDPEATAVTVDGVTFMDRNLGAISATPGDVGSIGQAYQWGRKDPMPRIARLDASANKGYFDIYDANGTAYVEDSGDETYFRILNASSMDTAISKPDHYIKAGSNRAWWIDSGDDWKDWWGGVTGVKSMYDPCPRGWKVPVLKKDPAGNETNPYAFMLTDGAVYDAVNLGVTYTDSQNQKLWFPCNGQRSRSKGWIHNPKSDGNYWIGTDMANPGEYEMCEYLYFSANGIALSGKVASGDRDVFAVLGCAVRCIKE